MTDFDPRSVTRRYFLQGAATLSGARFLPAALARSADNGEAATSSKSSEGVKEAPGVFPLSKAALAAISTSELIYISHLRITSGGALDASGTPRSYVGSAVTQLESEMGGLLKSLFSATVPGRAVQPGWIQALLFVSADVEVQPAPGQAQQIDQEGTVVSLGSPGYNVVSGVIETNCSSPVKFVQGYKAIQLPGNLTITDPRQSVLVRLLVGDRYWFYAAGLGEAGTAAAAHYLAKSWRRLDRRYRGSPSFFVALELSSNDYRNTRIISEAALWR